MQREGAGSPSSGWCTGNLPSRWPPRRVAGVGGHQINGPARLVAAAARGGRGHPRALQERRAPGGSGCRLRTSAFTGDDICLCLGVHL